MKLPAAAVLNRKIPKQKFYDKLSVTPALKRVFVEEIESITWYGKIATATVNVAAGQDVTEIQVFTLKLKQQALDTQVLRLIDREIPYHILYLLEYSGETQAWLGYNTVYYHTEWLAADALALTLEGLTLDDVYENFLRQIAGERLVGAEREDLATAVSRDEHRRKLRQKIAELEKRIQRERQFNRQVELNAELKELKKQYSELNVGG
jgi:hypothetical protein